MSTPLDILRSRERTRQAINLLAGAVYKAAFTEEGLDGPEAESILAQAGELLGRDLLPPVEEGLEI